MVANMQPDYGYMKPVLGFESSLFVWILAMFLFEVYLGGVVAKHSGKLRSELVTQCLTCYALCIPAIVLNKAMTAL